MSIPKVKIAAIGLGNRTCKYLRYIAEHKDICELVAAVDSDERQFHKILKLFDLPSDRCFKSLESLIASEIGIDACIIGTPDIYHYEMTLKAMMAGWHVLLEKPMAQAIEDCQEIVRVSNETRKLVSVCYVLRYHPYFIKLKQLTEKPEVGKIISVHHTEKVGKDRMTHTFIRGPWNKTELNTSVFFTKCCHDVDYVIWLTGEDISSIESTRGRKIFNGADAPDGAAKRCIDCLIENECIFSAVDLYLRRKEWIKGFTPMPDETQDEAIKRIITESRYGRCVYNCPENDVLDFQEVSFNTSSGIKAHIRMECTTEESERITQIECENAIISGNECSIIINYKDRTPTESYDFSWTKSLPFHAGADMMIIHDFIDAILKGDLQTRTTVNSALISHRVCFVAE